MRLYVADAALAAGAEFDLPPGAARHVQVRRAQPGQALWLFDGHGGEWRAEVTRMGRQQVAVRVIAHETVDREPGLAAHIAVVMPANDRMDDLVEKATELGVATLQPLMGERSVLRLAGDRAARKTEHWQAVAVAASEQCGRTRVPLVAPVLALPAWLAALPAESAETRLLLSPGAPALPDVVGAVAGLGALRLLSGPEGGLSAAEETLAAACGFVRAGLGPRVLRADTAPLAVLAWAMLQAGA